MPRRRLIGGANRKAVISRNGDVLPTFLVDGRVAGLWWVEPDGQRTRIVREPFGRVSRTARRTLDEEAQGLRALYEPLEPRLFSRYRKSAARGMVSPP